MYGGCVLTFYLILCTWYEFLRLMECFPPTFHLVFLKVHFNFSKSSHFPLTRAFIFLFSFQRITHPELFLQDVAVQKLFLREGNGFPWRFFSPNFSYPHTEQSYYPFWMYIRLTCVLDVSALLMSIWRSSSGFYPSLPSVGRLKGEVDLEKHQIYSFFQHLGSLGLFRVLLVHGWSQSRVSLSSLENSALLSF